MKSFYEVVQDLHHLIGLRIESIRPGAHLTIVDIDADSIHLNTTSGYRSRSLNELKRIWDEMALRPAVHVDEVLHGSGTSRNQPETILANLPYVEWVVINNKKHIAFVGEPTHQYGSLKKMDPIKADETKQRLNTEKSARKIVSLVVSPDVSGAVESLKQIDIGVVTALASGIYQYATENGIYIVTTPEKAGVSAGAYPVINKAKCTVAQRVLSLGTITLRYFTSNGLIFFIS